ncbi:MAG: sialidase family protein [Planctomycetota bacterium]
MKNFSTKGTRRQFLGAVTAAGVASMTRPAASAPAQAAKILTTKTISQQAELYCGWPTLARRSNGQLVLAWSGGRESHVCPFGRVEFMRSSDEGETWSWPRVLSDTAIDDRDAGVVETAKGTLLVTTFTSLAFESVFPKGDAARVARWKAAQGRTSADERKKQLGEWMLRSTDGGITWSAPYRTGVNSPHGPISLKGGRLLYAGKELWHGENRIGVCESTDDGQTWNWLATIPTRPGDRHRDYHELHAAECESGKLVVHIRNHNGATSRETLQTESTDGGKTWTVPHSIGVWGLPSHLLRLRDGRLLMSYGHRRPPFGNQARVSSDDGATWSAPLTISKDGAGGDLGYPSTVELEGGDLLTVWYEKMRSTPRAVLRQARWRLE